MTTTFISSFFGTIAGMIIWHYIKVGKFREHREQFEHFSIQLKTDIEKIKDSLDSIIKHQNNNCNKD